MTETQVRHGDLETLMARLERENSLKHDLIVPSRCMAMDRTAMIVHRGELDRMLADNGIVSADSRYVPTQYAHSEISSKLAIPKKFYDYLRSEHTDLFDHTVTNLVQRSGQNFFVRLFREDAVAGTPGIMRAMLSDRFQVIDHLDVVMTALAAIQSSGVSVKIERCDLTDSMLYMSVVAPDVEVQAPELLERYRVPGRHRAPENPHGVVAGFVISNSEVGRGAFQVAPRLKVLACSNGLIRTEDRLYRRHVGAQVEPGIVRASTATRQRELQYVSSYIVDAVTQFLSPAYLGRVVQDIIQHGVQELQYPVQAVENVCREWGFGDARVRDVLNFFSQSGDTTRFGAIQAATYYAHQSADADTQYWIEGRALRALRNMSAFDRPQVAKRRTPAETEIDIDM